MREEAEVVLLRAMENGRMPHGVLLYGAELAALERTCRRLAAQLLEVEEGAVAMHPDFHTLRPANKMRRINVEDTRQIVRQVQHSTVAGGQKVVVVYEADRMRDDSADTFLKTLEEPPPGCTLFLLSTRPTHLLDTVRSRCLQFQVRTEGAELQHSDWVSWLDDLQAWVSRAGGVLNAAVVTALIFELYGLASRFDGLLKAVGREEWERVVETLPEGMSDEQRVAMETGVLKGIRQRWLAEMAERANRICGARPDEQSVRALAEALRELERAHGLLEVNLGDAAAIEYVLLRWLRAWGARA